MNWRIPWPALLLIAACSQAAKPVDHDTWRQQFMARCTAAASQAQPRDGVTALCDCTAKAIGRELAADPNALARLQELADQAAPGCTFKPEGPDWALPVPPPRAPTLHTNYAPPAPQHTAAHAALYKADRLKGRRKYAEAEAAYLQAMKLDPKLSLAAYQLACNHALAQRAEPALSMLRRALDLGFSSYARARDDSDLSLLRQSPRYHAFLKEVRARQLAAPPRAGTPIVVVPTSKRPAAGYPSIVLLHGYGHNADAYLDAAKAWAQLGFVAIALPGSIPRGDGRFFWSPDSLDVTHEHVQAALKSSLVASKTDPRRSYLLGFSQGGVHAFQLAALHADTYRGVVAVSPGGPPWVLKQRLPSAAVHPRLVAVYGARDGAQGTTRQCLKLANAAGWQTKTVAHTGGHAFPTNWAQRRAEVAWFLTTGKE